MTDAELLQSFPSDFEWGVATSSFQIEGAATEAGKGESIWDRFCRQPGVIADASNGDVACDHVHRWREDLDLIASLGVQSYRFSVSWPRVQPLGQGAWNEAGLDFYERLVDGLLERGIQPWLTLNHWDLPQALQDLGGWGARSTAQAFVDYAMGVYRRLGDRVAGITTHNEPWVVAVLGHENGVFAPGLRDKALAMQVTHHLLLSHGWTLQALRAAGCRSKLGIVLNLAAIEAATDTDADRERARRDDAHGMRWYLEPLLLGRYPEEVLADLGDAAPRVLPGDLAAMAAPMDYLGINYYTRHMASAGAPYDPKTGGLPLTDMGWEIYPQGLTNLLVSLHRRYRLPPVYITENGAAFADVVAPDGGVHDPQRIDYLRTHMAAVAQARAQGAPVAGYMVWSLMDNFEWASGYAKRFGIVHVDYATQRRTLKDSALWYRRFLAQRRGS